MITPVWIHCTVRKLYMLLNFKMLCLYLTFNHILSGNHTLVNMRNCQICLTMHVTEKRLCFKYGPQISFVNISTNFVETVKQLHYNRYVSCLGGVEVMHWTWYKRSWDRFPDLTRMLMFAFFDIFFVFFPCLVQNIFVINSCHSFCNVVSFTNNIAKCVTNYQGIKIQT